MGDLNDMGNDMYGNDTGYYYFGRATVVTSGAYDGGCVSLIDCSDCSDCSGCSGCSGCLTV